jgi:ATP-dependent helicase HrpA
MAAGHEIRYLVRKSGKLKPDQKLKTRIGRLEKRLLASEHKRDQRKKNVPDLRFNQELPIFAKKDEIIRTISRQRVTVVSGETGSGKTTQLPKFCLAAGRGIDGLIGCTQPRRIAASTVARRIAEELGQELGNAVGYKIRFKDRTSGDAYIKMMTDGILLAEAQNDPNLSTYDTIIVDEAHERSLNIDFILGILQTLVAKRADLKLIITSATIDTEKFSRTFGDAPVIEVSGRMYPVEVRYPKFTDDATQLNELTHVEMAGQAVKQVLSEGRTGDILVFMPTEQDIRDTCDMIEAQNLKSVHTLPLFARLTAREQRRVFARQPERKIVVATNVAETSITIPGIKYVIDSGLARVSRYSPRSRTTSLPVVPISKSSCDQRKGRCGRVQNGVCIRLFTKEDYETRPQYTPPEILRANLAEVILRMISLNLGDISKFPFVDCPELKSIKDGFELLVELGAIEQRAKGKGQRAEGRGQRAKGRSLNAEVGYGNAERIKGNRRREVDGSAQGVSLEGKAQFRYVLTKKGRLMARIPLDPRLSRMLIEAKKEDCVDEMAIIVAALSIQDPRERPVEKAQEADRVHATFHDVQSDFVTLLNLWHRYQGHQQMVKSNNQMKRYCREHFLSYMRMREWRDIHQQISAILKEHGFWHGKGRKRRSEDGRRPPAHRRLHLRPGGNAEGGRGNSERGIRNAERKKLKREGEKAKAEMPLNSEFELSDSAYEKIHKSVLSGFLSNIAQKKENNIYRATKGREVMIFPGSGLFNKAKNWIVAEEMMETSRLFARTVANIDSEWLEALGGDLCRRTYLDPHWEKNRGEVVAAEQVTLFGLIIAAGRKVSYGKVNPDEAASIFIQSALINGDVKKPLTFMRYNRKLIDEIQDMENRFRRRDLLVDEQNMFDFYRKRLPGICDIRSLGKYLKRKGTDRFLRMDKNALLQYQPDQAELGQYPNRLDINRHEFECSYCFDPGMDTDGVTLKVPTALSQSISPDSTDWLVPGLYPQKIEALIKGLPKAYRKKLVPVNHTVDIIVHEMPKRPSSLVSVLSDFIYRRFGVDIPAAAWATDSLPDHLKMRISITAPDGREVQAGRDLALLWQDTSSSQKSDQFDAACKKWEVDGITHWDFNDLPEFVGESGNKKTNWVAYPALVAGSETNQVKKSVNLRLFRLQGKALAAHREGVAILYEIHFAKQLKFLKRQLILPAKVRFKADYFGGPKRLVQEMYNRVIAELFTRNIRSRKAFYAHADLVAAKILPTGRELVDKVIPILNAYHDARNRIDEIQQANRNTRMAISYFEERGRELEHLVPPTFVAIYDIRRLDHLPRYLQAVAIRAYRAAVDFDKDRAKSKEIIRFSEKLNQMLKALSPAVSNEKRQAIESYFWMLEEFKVSVFAQELKTAIPVSAKRLDQKLKEIDRMV